MILSVRLLELPGFSSEFAVRSPKREPQPKNPVSTKAAVDPALAEAERASLERVRAGDLSAYRELVERYEQRVHAIAFGIVGNHQDAEDVVQEAFLKAYRNLDSFRGQSSFYTWLYRIVFNLSIDLSRKRYRHVEASVGDLRSLDSTAQGGAMAIGVDKALVPSAEDEYRRKELRQHIQAAIDKLSPDHRTVIVLREIDGLSYSEISDVVGCSKGTVMSRLHHARRRLQQALQEFLPTARSEDAHETQTGSDENYG